MGNSDWLNLANSADGVLDADGDDATNAEEYASGIDPNNPLDTLRIDELRQDGSNKWWLQSVALSNQTYSVLGHRELTSGAAWSNIADVVAALTNRLFELRVRASGDKGERYFRIVTPRPP